MHFTRYQEPDAAVIFALRPSKGEILARGGPIPTPRPLIKIRQAFIALMIPQVILTLLITGQISGFAEALAMISSELIRPLLAGWPSQW